MNLNLPPEYEASRPSKSGNWPDTLLLVVDRKEDGYCVCRLYSDGKVRPFPRPESYGLKGAQDSFLYYEFGSYQKAAAWVETMCALNLWVEE